MGKYRIMVNMEECIATERCALACLHACPTKVLAHRPLDPAKTVGDVLIQATHPLLCDGCMACVKACEQNAITIETPSDP